jgi:hypothetical protein
MMRERQEAGNVSYDAAASLALALHPLGRDLPGRIARSGIALFPRANPDRGMEGQMTMNKIPGGAIARPREERRVKVAPGERYRRSLRSGEGTSDD